MKKILMVLLCLVLTAGVFGCGNGNTGGGDIIVPKYETEREMMIGAWVEPRNTLADYQKAKDMGLTHMFMNGYFTGGIHTTAFEQVLEYCDEVGLKAIVGVGNHTDDQPRNNTTDYTKYPAVTGINWWDEPFMERFDAAAGLVDYHMDTFGDKLLCFMNLNPNEKTAGWRPWPDDKNYNDYVDEFVSKVLNKVTVGHKMLSCDIYPMLLGIGDKPVLKSYWLPNVEKIALAAKENNADTHFFIQVAAGSYGGVTRPIITEKDLRFQIFSEMAFGIRNFSYFLYSDHGEKGTPDFMNGIADNKTGQTYPVYESAKAVNAELKALQNIYLSFEWIGTLPVIGEQNISGINPNFNNLAEPLEEISFIKTYSASQDALMGAFIDDEGHDGLVVTNFAHPGDNLENEIVIVFKNAKKVALYSKGEEKIYNLNNNKLELFLEPGEGVFLIPLA